MVARGRQGSRAQVLRVLWVLACHQGDDNSTCENNTVARETMARSDAGLTWTPTNRGAPVSLDRLFQPLGGS